MVMQSNAYVDEDTARLRIAIANMEIRESEARRALDGDDRTLSLGDGLRSLGHSLICVATLIAIAIVFASSHGH